MSSHQAPRKLWWAPNTPIQYTEVNGVKIRHIEVGQGPNLVLLHTLRTHLDIFHNVVPRLSEFFTIHAMDYPGHGYSDIPRTNYTPEFFADSVEVFLAVRKIEDAKVAGVSIGGSIALMLAARNNPRLNRVIAINPCDYKGGGVGRGNLIANAVFTSFKIPLLGKITMLLNNRFVERKVFDGGVAQPASMSKEFSDQVFSIGTRPGYATAFLNLVKHVNLWNEIKENYANINIPTLLVYGEQDWSSASERAKTAKMIPSVKVEHIQNGGHFLVIDQPEEVIRIIDSF